MRHPSLLHSTFPTPPPSQPGILPTFLLVGTVSLGAYTTGALFPHPYTSKWVIRNSVVLVHVGRGLCGHDGIVHGGLLATLLDESLARTAINNLSDKIGVTAKLSISYRAPTFADQFIVIKVHLEEKNGCKVNISGSVKYLKGNLLIEANTMFVQPKYSKMLSNSIVKKAMGEPEPRKKGPVLLAEGIPPPATKS